MENWPRVTYTRRPSPPMFSSPGKHPAMPAGTSASLPQEHTGGSQGSDSRMDRMMGSTEFTTAMGRLVLIRFCSSRSSTRLLEENTFALPSLPNRMARLSNTASPQMDTGRAAPTKASAVTR